MTTSNVLIVFDLDGTLVDAFGDIAAALNHALAQSGLPLHDLATIRSWVGNGLHVLCQRALPPESAHLDQVVTDAARRYYEENPADHAQLYPGIRELLQGLKARGLRLAILTNKPDSITQALCRELGLDQVMEVIAGGRAGVPLKPSPLALQELARRASAENVVVVGDGMPDAELTQRVRCPFIGVSWGIAPETSLAAYGPVAHDVEELAMFLDTVLDGLASDR